MQNFTKKFLAYCILFGAIVACNSNSTKQINRSCDLVRNDIEFMTKMILENHPGPKNKHDPEFVKILEKAHREAIVGVEKVSSVKEHVELLKKYVESFNDGHVKIFFNLETKDSQACLDNVIGPKQQSNIFSLREFMPGSIWITLPRFWTKNQEEIDKLHDIIAQMPKFRNKRLIIFDVRGNGGGSSSWGARMLEALFGKEYVERKNAESSHNVYVEWRASKGNAEHLQWDIDSKKKQFGAQSEPVVWALGQHRRMVRAVNAGAVLCSEHDDCGVRGDGFEQSLVVDAYPKKMCSVKIIALIDDSCFSSTLMFLDDLKCLDHPVLFVGKTTGADTCYGDSRDVRLPSGIGSFMFPMRVWRNRKRGSNQPYYPDVVYPGNINDTQALVQWLKQSVIDKFLVVQ